MRQRTAPTRLAAALCAVLAACGGSPEGRYEKLERGDTPLVVILLDTLRADHLGCYGYDRDTSPAIDAFADEAVVFDRCISQSSWTRPATASLLTGLYPSRHGATSPHTGLPASRETLAERLRARGYATAAFGSNPHVFRDTGFDQGFDVFVEPPHESPKVPYARGESIVDAALAWLDERREDEPYFLYVHLFDVHAPYDPPGDYRARFDRGFESEYDAWHMLQRDAEASDFTDDDWQHMIDLYDGEIAYADHHVGRLLDRLDLDETAVVILSDHGEEFGEHGGWSHEPTMYEELLHVPLIASFPALRDAGVTGMRVDELALLIDVVPTILDAVGEAPEDELEGKSLLAKALGAADPTPFAISEASQHGQYRKSVRSPDAKFVRTWMPAEGEVLFDLTADPGETTSVLDSKENVAELLRRVLDIHVGTAPGRLKIVFENQSKTTRTLTAVIGSEVARVEGVSLFEAELPADAAEGATGVDGPVLAMEQSEGARGFYGVTVTLRTDPGDRDGIEFECPADDKTLQIVFNMPHGPVPVSLVRIGKDGVQPEGEMPIRLGDLERFTSAAEPPSPGPDTPVSVKIWRSVDGAGETLELTPEMRAEMEKLGYLDD